jgi:NAD(P)-dependent dehydrogenase (short-subunit alcohol dehydrogenase family)
MVNGKLRVGPTMLSGLTAPGVTHRCCEIRVPVISESCSVDAQSKAFAHAGMQGDRGSAGVDAFGVPLDVTDSASVTAAAAQLKQQGGLDVLVNNAAITGGAPQEPTLVNPETVLQVVDTNVIGVIRVTNAMLPLLRRSASPRIVNISSGVGSLTLQTAQREAVGPISAAYSPSKTYLNAVTVQYAKELADTPILINMGCPGYVDTDLNGHQGTRTVEEGATIAIHLATLPDGGPTGTYSNEDGPLPW